ncbi:MobP3 family relaxase [Oscillibacter sp. PEA192]|uniref:MobP3 family relaxase n=1 Tax=Oscillibacter sp. PEA192 TaxID=2109687 RepID=UPI000E6578BD
MARIVLISPYLKGGQNAAKLAQRTRYVATRPGVELLADERSILPATKKQRDFITRLLKSFPSCWELIEYEEYLDHPTQGSASAFIQQVREDYMEALEQKENFIDYISHRPDVQKDGEHGLWDAHGKVQNLAQAVREVAEHSGNVWTPVIALRREDAERLGYDSAENWQALVNASICDIAKAYKIRPENLRWYAAFHQKPNQVHIHMIIFSADPKEGYLTKEGIRQVKSVFARRIYHADRMHIYQQKDIARQELQMQTRKAMVECIAQLKHGAVDNPRLEQLTEELAERLLTVKGRKVYGYLPPRVKAIVDAIVEELAKDERVSAAYKTWQTLYEQVCLDYDQRPPKRLTLSQQKEFRSVRNMVIQETLQWMAERQRCADAQRTSATSVESISPENSAAAKNAKVESTAPAVPAQPKSDRAASATSEDPGSADAIASKDAAPPADETPPMPSQQSGQTEQHAPVESDYHAPTVGETVVRMLHHMSGIFEDNSKIDQIHRGLQIDRKRRQELQRKRLAMGHKPDDHEEQMFR